MDFRVDLDTFRGPLDLLLYLVRKHEVDIENVPVALITEQYLQYLEVLEDLDVDDVGDFIEMASTLLEIKSRMVLPSGGEETEELDDARDDADIGVIILTGEGDKAFCSGGDQSVREQGGYAGDDGVPRLNVLDLQRQIRTLPKPVVLSGQTVQPLGDVEREYILAVLKHNDGNRTRTAKQLRIGSATLYRKLKSYGL